MKWKVVLGAAGALAIAGIVILDNEAKADNSARRQRANERAKKQEGRRHKANSRLLYGSFHGPVVDPDPNSRRRPLSSRLFDPSPKLDRQSQSAQYPHVPVWN